MATGLVLNLESVGDAKPEETIRTMSNVARALKVMAACIVNGVYISINPEDDPAEVIKFYERRKGLRPNARSLALVRDDKEPA